MVPDTTEPAGMATRPASSVTSVTTVARNASPGFAVRDVIVSIMDMENCRPASRVRPAGAFGGVAAASAVRSAGLQYANASVPSARATLIQGVDFMGTSVVLRETCTGARVQRDGSSNGGWGDGSRLSDGCGRPAVGRRPIAELAVDVGAPAVRGPSRADRAGVETAGDQTGEGHASGQGDGGRRPPVDGRAIADLAVSIVTPAVGLSRRGQPASVEVHGGQNGERHRADDDGRDPAI